MITPFNCVNKSNTVKKSSGTLMKPYIWKKPTAWSKIKTFLCGMSSGTVLHGDKMESIPDFAIFERKRILKRSNCFRLDSLLCMRR